MAEDQPEGSTTATVTTVSPEMVAITLLGQAVTAGFRETNANIQLVANDLSLVKERVSILEADRPKYSGGLRNLSASDAGQNQELANLSEKVTGLIAAHESLTKSQELQLAILGRLDKFAANPNVKIILAIAATALASWAASKGLK